jgi:hypothetical protein
MDAGEEDGMHADPMDRIGPATLLGSEIEGRSSVSTAVLFARAVALPFVHWRRWLAYGFVPCCILAGEAYAFYLGSATWAGPLRIDPAAGGVANPNTLAALFLGLPLLSCYALGFWLCAWQRDVARHFVDPIGKSLLRSLLRLPSYLPALAIWVIVPTAILIAMNAILIDGLLGRLDDIGFMSHTAPIRVWLALGGGLVALLFSLWLSARFSPLPALVAARGWQGAFGNAWNLSEGRGLGIALSFFIYIFLGGCIGAAAAAGAVAICLAADIRFDGSAEFVVAALSIFALTASVIAQFLCTSLAAMVARELVGEAEIDPSMFD